MNEKLQKVMQKVVQLRALAARAGTIAEAETAAAQAEALIVKYQIDEAQIVTSPEQDEPLGEHEPIWTGRTNEAWRGTLCAGLSKDHGCGVIAYKGTGKTTVYRIAGRKSDVEIVRYLFAWLTVEIERLAQSEHGRANKTAFRVGAAMGVIRAMRATRAVEIQAAPTGASAALVLTNRHEDALSHMKAVIGGTFRAGQVRRVASDAFSRGLAAGDRLSPRTSLGGGSVKMLGSGR